MLNLRLRLATVIFLPLALLYIVFNYRNNITDQHALVKTQLSWLTGQDKVEKNGLLVAEGMQSWMNYSLDISDFARKGDRVKAVASFMSIVKGHPTKKLRDRLSRVIEAEYPWWYGDFEEFVPWEKRWSEKGHDTGFTICVASKDFTMAAQLIQTIRNVHGSRLSIEIAFAGDEDLSPKHQKALKALGYQIYLLNLLDHFNETEVGLQNGNSALKPFAVIASRFQQVLLLDADTVFLQSPDNLLLNSPSYHNTGLLLYHDIAYRASNSTREWIDSKLHFRNLSTELISSLFWRENLSQEMSSGVVGVDKTRPEAFMTILFAAWMNTEPVREQETYQHLQGDKETYWLAAEFARLPYSFVAEYAGIIGMADEEQGNRGKICSTHIAHMDEQSMEPIWFNGGVVRNSALEDRDTRYSTLGEFTHYITAGTEIDEQPSWVDVGDGVWCAEGGETIAIDADGELAGVIGRMFEKVREEGM